MLQQAQAEEELELQKALCACIESERALLEQDRVDEACVTSDGGEPMSGACAAAQEDEISKQAEARRAQATNLRHEQVLMEARVEQLRAQVEEYQISHVQPDKADSEESQ